MCLFGKNIKKNMAQVAQMAQIRVNIFSKFVPFVPLVPVQIFTCANQNHGIYT